MRRPALVLTLFVVLLAPAAAWPSVTHACTGLVEDPVVVADAIIAGRVVGMRLAPEFDAPSAAWIEFEVDRYLKGSGPAVLPVLEPVSVIRSASAPADDPFRGAHYIGFGGPCGVLREDPRGQYWVLGVTFQEDGSATTNMGLMIFVPAGDESTDGVGTSADDPEILATVAEVERRLASYGLPAPAAVGHGVEGQRSTLPLGLALAAITVVLLLGGRGVGRFR